MSNEEAINTGRWPRRVQALAGAYALGGGLLSFLGWVLGIRRLTDWVSSGISIQANAAITAAAQRGHEASRLPADRRSGEGVERAAGAVAESAGVDRDAGGEDRRGRPFEDVPKEARALVRQSAVMAAAAKDSRLKKRTLTNLYNERPTWLKIAHEHLNHAVLAAYAATDPAGECPEDWAAVWTDTGAGQPLPAEHPLFARRAEVDQKVLANLLRMNHARAKGVETVTLNRKLARRTSPARRKKAGPIQSKEA